MPSMRHGFLVALALSVAGCVVDRTEPAPRLGVETTSYVYDLSGARCATAASHVRHLVAASSNDRPESVRVRIDGARDACMTTIVKAIEGVGVEPSHIGLSDAVPSHHGMRVQVERLVVTHASCQLSDGFNRGIFTENDSDPALGCSTAAALGAMVADPGDLDLGKGRSRAEGEPATRAVAVLRGGQDTPAARSVEGHRQAADRPTP